MQQSHAGRQHDESALRRRGQRLTPQRRLVLGIMQNSHGHMSVSDVMSEVERLRDPARQISLASVYRVLGWLAEHDIVSVTDVGERDLVYEYLGHGRHHHLICRQCGFTSAIPDSIFAHVIDTIHTRYGFEARMEHQAVFGTCQNCPDVRPEPATSTT